jgi:hypothetical protein
MSRPIKAMSEQLKEFEFMQGGKPPEAAWKTHLAALQKAFGAEINEKLAMRQQAAMYLGQISTPAGAPAGTKAEEAMKALRAITDRIAKQKPPAPKEVFAPPSFWGQYTMVFTPVLYVTEGLGPYSSGQITSQTGNPTTVATGNETLGQLTCGVDTNYESPSSATATNLLGVFFQPKFPQANVRISFASQLFYSWYVNSIHGKESNSEAQGLLELYEYDGAFLQPPLRSRAFLNFSETGMNSVNFDVVNEAGPTWALEAPVIFNPNLSYAIVVRLTCCAGGTGWPGGLAGANATVTVPSITLTVTAPGATSIS